MRSEVLLQCFILLVCAAIISLGVSLRFYPWVKNAAHYYRQKSQVAALETDITGPLDLVIPSPVAKISPHKIRIPKLGLDLAVYQATIENNQWALYDDKVSWLATSAQPKQGNVILYAHNRPHLFGNLTKLKVGDLIEVDHSDKTYSYEVRALKRVSPKDVEAVIADTNQITLYTCDGAFDQKRLVVTAIPQD